MREVRAAEHWVFIHGWGSDSRLWAPLCAHLPGHHHFIDLPGFGSAPEDPVDVDLFLSQAAERLPEQCVLVGWSLGGMLATQLAVRYPAKIGGLITLASNAVFVERPDWPAAMPAAAFTQFLADFCEQAQSTWSRFCALQAVGDHNRKHVLRALQQQTPPTAAVEAAWQQGLSWLAELDNRAALAELRMPQLHILGEADALVPAACAAALADRVPSAGVQVLKAVGHAPHLSDPPKVAALIQHWRYPPIDKALIARSFSDAATRYDEFAHVQRRVARDLAALCPALSTQAKVLDLGCGTGFVAQLLAPAVEAARANVILADIALPMVQLARRKLAASNPSVLYGGLVADAEALPLAENAIHSIVSSLAFQWCHDLAGVAREAARVLQPGGHLVFSTLGPDTLWELKCTWEQLDRYTHVNHFETPEQIRAALETAGLRVSRLDRYPVVAHYAELMPLLQELKAIGAHNMNRGRKPGLTGARQLRELERVYRALHGTDSDLPATYDVILVQAEKP